MKWKLLQWGTAPHVYTICLPDATASDHISQTFPSIFAYCKRSKTGGGNGLGVRLHVCLAYTVHVDQYLAYTLHVGQFGGYPFRVCTCPTYLCTPQLSTWLADVTHGIFSFSDLHVLVVTLPLPLSLRTIVLPG